MILEAKACLFGEEKEGRGKGGGREEREGEREVEGDGVTGVAKHGAQKQREEAGGMDLLYLACLGAGSKLGQSRGCGRESWACMALGVKEAGGGITGFLTC